jgi:hypothetical protein
VSAADRTSAGEFPLVDGVRTFTFRKIFVYVTPQASATTTLTVIRPDTAALFYQPQYEDSGEVLQLSAADRIASSTRQVSFENCNKTTTG